MLIEKGGRELVLLNPIKDVSEDDKLYRREGDIVEKFDSHLVILAHISEQSRGS